MAGLISQAAKKKLPRAGDAQHDPADLSGRGTDTAVLPAGRLVVIPLEDLTSNPRNLRDNEALRDDPETGELAASMAIIGQQQPAVAVPRAVYIQRWPEHSAEITTAWVVMIGNRRLISAGMNGWPGLECVTRDRITPDLEQLDDLAFHENIHRADLNPLKVAFYLRDRKKALGTEAAVATALGKSQPWVNQLLQLTRLAPELQAHVQAGGLTSAVARELVRLPHDEQRRIAAAADELTPSQRPEYWRARAWNQPSGNALPNEPRAPVPSAEAETRTGTRAAGTQPTEDLEPRTATTARIRIDNPKHTAADLRKHLDSDQLAALRTELRRRGAAAPGKRT